MYLRISNEKMNAKKFLIQVFAFVVQKWAYTKRQKRSIYKGNNNENLIASLGSAEYRNDKLKRLYNAEISEGRFINDINISLQALPV